MQSGDRIRLSVKDRSIDVLLSDAEFAERRAAWVRPAAPKRGWDKLTHDQVLQAPDGCDLGFLRPDGA